MKQGMSGGDHTPSGQANDKKVSTGKQSSVSSVDEEAMEEGNSGNSHMAEFEDWLVGMGWAMPSQNR